MSCDGAPPLRHVGVELADTLLLHCLYMAWHQGRARTKSGKTRQIYESAICFGSALVKCAVHVFQTSHIDAAN